MRAVTSTARRSSRGSALLAAALWCLGAEACRSVDTPPELRPSPAGAPSPTGSTPPATRAGKAAPTTEAPTLPTRFPTPERLVAIGDVHGDLAATRRALRLAGAIDEQDRWVGGSLVVVQTGDQLDRGDDEQAILDLFERLRVEAEAQGGAFHALNGNHELMNVAGDLRYVTPGGFADFEDVEGVALDDPALARVPPQARSRAAAFLPGAAYARLLAQRNTVVIVGSSVFVHAGVLPKHVTRGVGDLERINADMRQWLWGGDDHGTLARDVMADDGVVWTRLYASDDAEACEQLGQALGRLQVERMVVGHTVQEGGITSGCDGRVWRIDVGLAAHYGGRTQVLVIEGNDVKPLSEGAG
jgi:hypothetical protein